MVFGLMVIVIIAVFLLGYRMGYIACFNYLSSEVEKEKSRMYDRKDITTSNN